MSSNTPVEIIVHHDGVSRSGPSLQIINDFHRTRDFPISALGFYVGYHYLIERDGLIIQTRREDEEGAHCIGHNFKSVGIGLAGNFDVETPTLYQITALGKLVTDIRYRWTIEVHAIVPHRLYAQKTCYGSLLSDHWAAIVGLKHELSVIMEKIALLQSLKSSAKTSP